MKVVIAEAETTQDTVSVISDKDAHPAQRYFLAVHGHKETVWQGEWSEGMRLDEALLTFARLVRERVLNSEEKFMRQELGY